MKPNQIDEQEALHLRLVAAYALIAFGIVVACAAISLLASVLH